MAKISEIISTLETFAPLNTQEEWDNSGWQIKLDDNVCKKAIVAINATEDVIKQAVELRCDLLITHHPMIFTEIKQINEGAMSLAIQNNIQVYSFHTNFDKAEKGTSYILAEKIGFETKKLTDYIQVARFEEPISIDTVIDKIKCGLNIKNIKIFNKNKKTQLKSIALSAGAVGDFIEQVEALEIDAFITSDITYHKALDSKEIVLFDVGHFESEVISLETIKTLTAKTGADVVIAKEEAIFEII